MRLSKRLKAILVAAAVAAAGCPLSPELDAGPTDAGGSDAGTRDAGLSNDDGGPTTDAGGAFDAGAGGDAGSYDAGASDAGAERDAGPGRDAGTSRDAGQPPRLAISGADVLDPDGHRIVLRGYNWGKWGTAVAQDAVDNLAQGANSVRLPLRWWGDWKPGVDCRNEGDGGVAHIDLAHLTVLDDTVRWATDNQLWTVIFVDSNYGQGAHGSTDNFWTDAAMKQEFIEVWQFIAARYANTPYIAAYEILPEPQVTTGDIKAFYEDLIRAIRQVDRVTPVVIGPGDAYNLNKLDTVVTTVDSKIIYTGDYFIFDKPLNRMAAVRDFGSTYHAPLWVNQVGIPSGDPDAGDKANAVLAGLNDAGIGWSWWTYRVLALTPNTHGIYYQDGDGGWLEKTDWYDLVGRSLVQ